PPALCLSFSLTPPTPPSPPFPYTTLFRSRPLRRCAHLSRRLPALPVFTHLPQRRWPAHARFRKHPAVLEAGDGVGCAVFGHRRRDRKSTRLNSSHEWISYAVFCLKKKTPE